MDETKGKILMQSTSPATTSDDGQVGQHSSTLKSNRFSFWGTIGVQFSVTASPLAIASWATLLPGAGGSPYLFWGYIVAVTGQLVTALSLAEMAGAFPSVSGQTYWTARLSSPKWARFLSYINGSFTCWGWILITAGSAVYAANFIASFGIILVADYTPHPWHIYLITIAVMAICLLFNSALIRAMSAITIFMVFFLNIAALFIFITLLAVTSPKASARTAFIDVVNETGWDSDGIVFMTGILPGCLTVALFDAAAHLAEETPNPSKDIPIVMVGNTVLSTLGGLIMILAIIFCTLHPENLVTPLAGQVILQIAHDAWPVQGFVITVCIIYIVMTSNGLSSVLLGASRIVWTFARSGGTPFQKWIGATDDHLEAPINAVLLSTVIPLLFSLLLFGPTTVLNALFGSGICCVVISYMIPNVLLLIKGRSQAFPSERHFRLGKWGTLINIVTICWSIIVCLFLSFPTVMPITSGNMNMTAAGLGVVMVLSMANWFIVKSNYKVPEGVLDNFLA